MSSRALAASVIAIVAAAACAKGNVGGTGVDADQLDGDSIDAPIDGPVSTCARQPCDILTQCGCEATPNTPVCDLDFANLATGATKCRADNFHGTETTTCTMATTCAADHVCVGGRCRMYCDDDNDCPGAGGLCIIALNASGAPIPDAPKTCTTDCVPSQTANPTCPTGWACHVYQDNPDGSTMPNGDERYLTDCDAPPGTGGGVGAACTGNPSCQPGLDCVTLNPGGNQCRPSCMCPGGNCAAGACTAGSGSCHGFTTPVVIGAVTYGTCF